MNNYGLWIFGILMVLNFGNFLFACFRIKTFNVRNQRLWARYILILLALNCFCGGICFSDILSENYLLLALFIVSLVLSCLSMALFYWCYVNKLKAGVYNFKITDKDCSKPEKVKIFGEIDAEKYPLEAELITENPDRYKIGDVLPVVVDYCDFDILDSLDGDIDIIVSPHR